MGLKILAAAAALALASTGAIADTASASAIASFQFQLIDLMPDDGIDPWIQFVITQQSGAVAGDPSGLVISSGITDSISKYNTNFWVSPNTEVLVTGTVFEELMVPDPQGWGLVHVHAVLGTGGYPADPRFDFLSVIRQNHAPFAFSETRPLELSYVNSTDARKPGVFVFGTQSAVQASDVPEPEESATMLAALALFGAGAIRSRRARS